MWLIATKGSDLYDTSLQSGLTCLVNPFKMVWPVWQLFLSTRSSLYVKLLLRGNTQKMPCLYGKSLLSIAAFISKAFPQGHITASTRGFEPATSTS